jgi:hypothetical protein
MSSLMQRYRKAEDRGKERGEDSGLVLAKARGHTAW